MATFPVRQAPIDQPQPIKSQLS